jgi:hypothetical protein
MANMGAWKKLGYGFASHDNYDYKLLTLVISKSHIGFGCLLDEAIYRI